MQGRRDGKRWKLAVAAVVIFFVSALFATMMLAGLNVKVLDHDYYRKGINYGQDGTEKNKASGWKTDCSLRSGVLRVKVTDSYGMPVIGAQADFTPRVPEKARSIPLEESEPGLYRADLTLQEKNEVRGTVVIKHGGAAVSEKVALFR